MITRESNTKSRIFIFVSSIFLIVSLLFLLTSKQSITGEYVKEQEVITEEAVKEQIAIQVANELQENPLQNFQLDRTLPATPEENNPQQPDSAAEDSITIIGPLGRPDPVSQNLDWYSFDIMPPFVNPGEDNPSRIYPGSAAFDVDNLPNLPSELRKADFDAANQFQPRYYIAHFNKPITRENQEILDSLTGLTKREDGTRLARRYVPNRGLLVFIKDEATLQRLKEEPTIDYLIPYEPGYKLGKIGFTRNNNGNMKYLTISLIPGHPKDDVISKLEEIGVTVIKDWEVRGTKGHDVRAIEVQTSSEMIVPMLFKIGRAHV